MSETRLRLTGRVARQIAFFVLVVLTTSACYVVTDTPEQTRIEMSPTAKQVLIAVPVIVIAIALVGLRRESKRLAFAVISGIAIVCAVFLPSVYLDALTLTPTGIWQRTGFWFNPNVRGFDFGHIRHIEIRRESRRNTDSDIWYLHSPNARVTRYDPGDLWENNSHVLIPRLKEHGITFACDRDTGAAPSC
jgi:hypothetical protein